MQRKSLVHRIGGALAVAAGVSLVASAGMFIVGMTEELRTPATEQVSSWVYRSREVAKPAMYLSIAPFIVGGVLYYASKKIEE